jgi:hypothetical protein
MNRYLSFSGIALALFSSGPALGFDAFNNYGPGDTYDTTTGYGINGTEMQAPLFLTPRTVGSRFTAEASGVLAVIRISLHDLFLTGFNQVDVRLHEATPAGDLGPIMAAFTRGGLPPSGGSEAPETITSFDPSVVLTTGNRYWIVVAPGDSTTEAIWNWAPAGGGRLAISTDSGASYAYSDGRQGAMRIEVIPEPATLVTLVLGFSSFVLAWRRRL